MDWKIHLLYYVLVFQILARNYLEAREAHPLMLEAKTLLKEVEMMPADIAEVFTRCDAEGEGIDTTMNEVVVEIRRPSSQRHTHAPPCRIYLSCDGRRHYTPTVGVAPLPTQSADVGAFSPPCLSFTRRTTVLFCRMRRIGAAQLLAMLPRRRKKANASAAPSSFPSSYQRLHHCRSWKL
ncbi:hypothetical protein ZIOFF_025143 [Zingiber officinale]|uniref:AAA+ ATPase At3g28540-like C-terminal domain-containing protein n=1 Tax=Zingiber officinale TaxID=94328 RepID=A0A8J5LJL8_ZINOF|nr:hypothetical protein ZIOFF_025143 [Zingiber officinale]